MKNIAHNLYLDPRNTPPAPLKYPWMIDPVDLRFFVKFSIKREDLKRLETLPQNFPPSDPPFGESSSQAQSTTTDISNRQDSTLVTRPVHNVGLRCVSQEALRYYPSTEPSWGVLAGKVEDRSDPLVAFISSSTSRHLHDLSRYSLEFRMQAVSMSKYISRTNDVTVEC
jgi:hypothetical protein